MCHLCIATPVLFSKHMRRRQCPLFVAVLLSGMEAIAMSLVAEDPVQETSVLNIDEYESL